MATGITAAKGSGAPITKTDTGPTSPDEAEVPREPKTLAEQFNALPSVGALQHAALAAAADPDADRVAMVTRDVNGDPMQSKNYVVLVAEDAPRVERDAAHNLAGQAQGAQHIKAGE